jgi:hypothetical protein
MALPTSRADTRLHRIETAAVALATFVLAGTATATADEVPVTSAQIIERMTAPAGTETWGIHFSIEECASTGLTRCDSLGDFTHRLKSARCERMRSHMLPLASLEEKSR